jgi:hypothetical protein
MLLNHLPAEQKGCLGSLVSALCEITPEPPGDRTIDLLYRFLLDNEQQTVLGLDPWNLFFLEAAAHLIEAHNTSEHMTNFEALRILDGKQARILSLICSSVHGEADKDDGFIELEPVEYKRQPINIPLISGAIRLATKLDIKNPSTAGTIAENLAQEDRIPFDQVCESYDIITMDPHPFLSGVIQVRIHCTHAGVHRALKNHEIRVQRLLNHANNHVSPRFLFSEVIFEIEPQGYAPLDMSSPLIPWPP